MSDDGAPRGPVRSWTGANCGRAGPRPPSFGADCAGWRGGMPVAVQRPAAFTQEPGDLRGRAHHDPCSAGVRRGGAAGDRPAASAARGHAAAADVLLLDCRPHHAAVGVVPVQHVRAAVPEDRHRRGGPGDGFAIGSLLNGVGARSLRGGSRLRPPGPGYDQPYGQRPCMASGAHPVAPGGEFPPQVPGSSSTWASPAASRSSRVIS